MKSLLYALNVLLTVCLFSLGCGGEKNFSGNGSFFGGSNEIPPPPFFLNCEPKANKDVSTLTDLPASVSVAGNSLSDFIQNQAVMVAFGSAVTSAEDFEGNPLNLNGEVLNTDSGGNIGVVLACSEIGNAANPCSVSFTTTYHGTTLRCVPTFI